MAANPYLLERPAVVSFSGGRTSGYMLWHIMQAFGGTLPDDVKVVFCNTGKERPETLDFVERCSQRWGVRVHWLEYRYETPIQCPTRDLDWKDLPDDEFGERTKRWNDWHMNMAPHRKAKVDEISRRKVLTRAERKMEPKRPSKTVGRHTFVEVDYTTASRCGEPLEEVIAARNMLPNVMARFCTVECKIRTTCRFLLSHGWTEWFNAIGFRADEPQRVAKLQTTNRHSREWPIAPMSKCGVTKSDVLNWWKRQSFDLGLQDHEGNCDLCFLKGAGKIRRVMKDRPDLAAWWIRMESAADRRGLARSPLVAFFRKDRPRYALQLKLAQAPTLFDEVEAADELSIACHCTD